MPQAAVQDALELLEKHQELGAFDALLAATARMAGCQALVTADRAFAAIDGLPVVFPDAESLSPFLP